jgi:deferrochelatase/peroxidase EfeB
MSQKRGRLRAALWLTGAVLVGAAAVLTVILWNGQGGREPFYGEHQAGIATSAQKFGIVTAFDVTVKNADELKTLLQTWTKTAAALTQGLPLGTPGPQSAPAADTGETIGYKPARLTITVGAGLSLFDARFGLEAKKPAALLPLPAFKGDRLNPEWSDGDLVVQVCADDYETAYHAIHVLTRDAKGSAVPRWVQSGFQPGLEVADHPARNLEGFIDGTVNPDASHAGTMESTVWLGPEAGWMEDGSYLVVRRIRMLVESWDRASLGDQENTIGRDKHTGKELAQQDPDSHVKLAHGDGTQKLLRRPFHYVNGLDAKTGQWDSGLLFLAWMKDPQTQFVPIQSRLSQSDLLNEYIKPVGSAVFAVFPGIKAGGFLGAGLFEVPIRQRIESLQGALGALYPAVASGDWAAVRQGAAAWNQSWQAERASAGSRAATIDALASVWTSSLTGTPDTAKTRAAQTALVKGLEEWKKTAAPKKAASITDLAGLKTILTALDKALAAGNVEASKTAFADFQREWLAREALVRGIDTNAYAFVETQAGGIRRAIIAQPAAWENARAITKALSAKLDGLQPPHAFGAWDAGFLLFREGLEALLVLAALLAFLGRTKQTQWTPWIWSGAGLGLAGSIGVAIAISVLMSGFMAATAPTLVEGLTGLAAVILMLAVGGWLHSKSTVKNWNVWLKDKLGTWGNSPWALGVLALLSVLREGAETVLFFWGLAGSLSPVDLLIGVAGALVVLTVLGIVMIGFSKRLPLNWFFPIATLLIYFLAVKILGQSVGSLQSAGVLPSTPLGFGGPIDAIGFIPTWEAAAPQLILAAVLVSLVVRSFLKARKKPAPPAVKPAEAPNP